MSSQCIRRLAVKAPTHHLTSTVYNQTAPCMVELGCMLKNGSRHSDRHLGRNASFYPRTERYSEGREGQPTKLLNVLNMIYALRSTKINQFFKLAKVNYDIVEYMYNKQDWCWPLSLLYA